MKYKTFSIRLPLDLANVIDHAALQQFRKQNARNQMITQILLDWQEAKGASVKRESNKARKTELATVNGG
jgi:hypothetical protein